MGKTKQVDEPKNTTRPGNPLWNEVVDENGRPSLEIHTPRKIWEACGDHFFSSPDEFGNVQCRSCGFGQKIVRGIHEIKKGKIYRIAS